jgi:NAD(P)-dependent dehydrogenase (short-subunit alcohol dehydrogenase family)
MNFKGKTVVITGGASGIGLALAKRIGSAGGRIILSEPDQGRIDEAVEQLSRLRIDAAGFAADVAEADAVEALADFAWSRNRRADVIINNAGIGGGRGALFDLDLDEARRVIDVNYWGVWHGACAFGRRFRKDGLPAAIYATASENALFNALPRGGSAYVSSKCAVLGLFDVLRREVPANITLGVIIPGWVATDMAGPQSKGVAMDPDDFAERIVPQMEAGAYYLVSHPYNVVRIEERMAEIYQAYARYAPRHPGDDGQDVQLWAQRAREAMAVKPQTQTEGDLSPAA